MTPAHPAIARALARLAQLGPLRRCYCPENRREEWRTGALVGDDQVYGTPDDLPIPGDDSTPVTPPAGDRRELAQGAAQDSGTEVPGSLRESWNS